LFYISWERNFKQLQHFHHFHVSHLGFFFRTCSLGLNEALDIWVFLGVGTTFVSSFCYVGNFDRIFLELNFEFFLQSHGFWSSVWIGIIFGGSSPHYVNIFF
jgi:hypothetical protein